MRPGIAADAAIGDSVAVDGCCLTVTQTDGVVLAFDAVPETLRRTNLGRLQPGDEVNLEPALRAGDRMGGHLVQGHVDAVGSLRDIAAEADAVNMTFTAPEQVLRYVIEKGSIAVDGEQYVGNVSARTYFVGSSLLAIAHLDKFAYVGVSALASLGSCHRSDAAARHRQRRPRLRARAGKNSIWPALDNAVAKKGLKVF